MNLILEYISSIQQIDKINKNGLRTGKQVRRNNKLADKIRAIASNIDCKYPEMKPDFYDLLFHENSSIRCWTAHHILEVMNYDNSCRKDALKEILYVATHDESSHSFGNKLWLKYWLKEHPSDKDLISDFVLPKN